MRTRVKEIEDMRELEKIAEELQSRGEEDDDENGDEGEGESWVEIPLVRYMWAIEHEGLREEIQVEGKGFYVCNNRTAISVGRNGSEILN
ncbi:hypothetical protein L1887_29390 [Cichorium endivia]|nr:hypothetical protein L1887_29390 [Cichorium endivia]